MIASFLVKGKPKGKGRPRFTKFGGVYTPKDTMDYEKLISAEFSKTRGINGWSLDVSGEAIEITIVSCFKSKKEPWELKPDVDNILKVFMDALTGVAYADDKQIVISHVLKVVGDEDFVHVTLEELLDKELI